jgi:nucleoside-diphosphate-sugar epimerase
MPIKKTSSIVVTGSSGYLGRRVANRLRAHGFHVIYVDRVSEINPIDLSNVTDMSKLDLPSHYLLIHLAFPLPGAMKAGDFKRVIDTINLNLTMCFSPERTLFISSTAVYPVNGSSESTVAPWEIYGQLKLCTEKAILENFKEVTIFRPGTLIDTDRKSSMMKFMNRLKFSKFPIFPGSGEVIHPFTHTEDLENAVLTWALDQGIEAGVYSITANEPMTLNEICYYSRNKKVLFEIRIPETFLRRLGSDRFPIMQISSWHFRALCYNYLDKETNPYRKNFRLYRDLFKA